MEAAGAKEVADALAAVAAAGAQADAEAGAAVEAAAATAAAATAAAATAAAGAAAAPEAEKVTAAQCDRYAVQVIGLQLQRTSNCALKLSLAYSCSVHMNKQRMDQPRCGGVSVGVSVSVLAPRCCSSTTRARAKASWT